MAAFEPSPNKKARALKGPSKDDLLYEVDGYNVCKAADWAMDGAWRSFYNWVDTLAGMPDGSFPLQRVIRKLKDTVFRDGMSFVVLPYRDVWKQSEQRINALLEGGFEPVIEELGGGPFLKNLKTAHARLGEVLGISVPLKASVDLPSRNPFQKLLWAFKSKFGRTC